MSPGGLQGHPSPLSCCAQPGTAGRLCTTLPVQPSLLTSCSFTNDGQLKLCDFGLARSFKPWEEPYTPGVVTLWYRWAPGVCSAPVDAWTWMRAGRRWGLWRLGRGWNREADGWFWRLAIACSSRY